MSAAAWEQWKQENFGDRNIHRSEWFELVDPKLQEINHLIQSSDGDDFKVGLQKLRDHISAAQQAESSIKSASGKECEGLLHVVRKGPKLLVTILKCLESESSRDEGKEKLFDLCDDVFASQTMIREMPTLNYSRQTTTARQEEQVETDGEGGASIRCSCPRLCTRSREPVSRTVTTASTTEPIQHSCYRIPANRPLPSQGRHLVTSQYRPLQILCRERSGARSRKTSSI
jgi:hypothetical protein